MLFRLTCVSDPDLETVEIAACHQVSYKLRATHLAAAASLVGVY